MPDIVRRSEAALRPLDPGLSVEVRDWVVELRTIWAVTGLSMNQFASAHPIDKGTISRYLNGQRVPGGRWFLEKLLAIQADSGQPVTKEVREHLTKLQSRALEVAHPHEYRVRQVNDELEIALTGKLEAERYARSLEGRLAERNRQVSELAEAKGRVQAAWDADRVGMQTDYERLTREIGEITGQLDLARQRTAQAEERCQILESLLDHLDTHASDGESNTEPSGANHEPLAFPVPARLEVIQGQGMPQPDPGERPSAPVDQDAAIEKLFRTAAPVLFSNALFLSQGDRKQAGDLVMQAFQAATTLWSTGRNPVGSLDEWEQIRWLGEILNRKAAEACRVGSWEGPIPDLNLYRETPYHLDLDRALIVMRKMPRVRHMVASLLLSGWSAEKVAMMLGIRQSAVMEHLMRAREELSKEIGPILPVENDGPDGSGLLGKGEAVS